MTTKTELAAKAKNLAEELKGQIEEIGRVVDDESAREQLLEELWTMPLAAERLITYRVTLGTGGPACGVDFRVDDEVLQYATVWWQDWFTERVHVELDEVTAEYLFEAWIAEV